MTVEILTPEGRIVEGHPMVWRDQMDDNNKPALKEDGTKKQTVYVGFAIRKTPGVTDWKAEPWGAQIDATAREGYPNGETMRPDFAWKITDGDSTIPNKRGKKPCDSEGFPGHWVLRLSTALQPARCFHVGKYDPMQQIQNEKEIKCGDYGRFLILAKDNAPSKSPGVYLNPSMFELIRAGQAIMSDSGPSAAAVFGAPAPAAASAPPAPPAPPSPPAPSAAAPAPEAFLVNGQSFTRDMLRNVGWTDDMINALPKV
jgi:hypothetical protein